ncbi:glutamine--tRNA ligase-like protein [Tanacetum coccineum]
MVVPAVTESQVAKTLPDAWDYKGKPATRSTTSGWASAAMILVIEIRTGDEIKEYREKKRNSPWRDRPISESLKLFNDMKEGRIDDGKATLRMKQDMQSDNASTDAPFCMDPQFTPHPHARDKWCIYPSYDYAHCIVDSLENITHSLCTLEFETRRASYYWLLDALSLYQPYVGEYSRLNITHTVLSKRKLNRLVTENYVDGWDDPRLMTLAGLRRRGVTSTAINTFVRGLGISRSDGSMIRLEKLEHIVRDELNKTAPRTIVMLHPLKVVITNLEATSVKFLAAKRWHEPLPGVDPLKVEVRLFNKLFKSENPGELDNWLDDLNPESKVVIPCAYGVPSLNFAEAILWLTRIQHLKSSYSTVPLHYETQTSLAASESVPTELRE